MTTQAPRFTNRLQHETSPYLRQHAHNPVDWYPWGPEALEQARRLDRPLFLSIGYSACHWCHVMEHESFENEAIARILNEHFISIKVDREERPDIDQIYMMAVQLLNQGHGGWPMSVFLTPQLRPFLADTYFPPEDRYGKRGFRTILMMIVDAWRTRRAEIDRAAGEITSHLQDFKQLPPAGTEEMSPELLRQATTALSRSFDPTNGGFGSAPKFPHPMEIRLLLRNWRRDGSAETLNMARQSLDHMARGGIYDHLGGGFARYSVDERWLVPHFEKMLYDNALLTSCYLEAFQATGDLSYRAVAEETLAFVRRELTRAEGPFMSTLDADSEGLEGKFYVWTEDEIVAVLGKADADLFNSVYGVAPLGNWHDPHGHAPSRSNVLHRVKAFDQIARLLDMPEPELRARLDACRQKLFEAREKRVRPGRDDKTLTAWNGLMIAAFAQAAQVLDDPSYAETAARAADFILTKMRTPDGRLLRTWSAGTEAKLNGYLEDYAFLIDALVTLYEATFAPRWVAAAVELADVMLDQFWDERDGGFFFTGRSHELLIARNKDPHDNAIPSGNAMAVTGLLRLAKLTGRADLLARAETTLKLFRGLMATHPMAAAQMLNALDFYLGPVEEVAIVGAPTAADSVRVVRALRSRFQPNRVVAFKPTGTADADYRAIPLLEGKQALGAVTVYVCANFACQAPLVGADAAVAALGG